MARAQQADDGRQCNQVVRCGGGEVLVVVTQDIANCVECQYFGEASQQPSISVSALDDIEPQDLRGGRIGAGDQSGGGGVGAGLTSEKLNT